MNWLLQDALVTALALGAFVVLVRRIVGAVAPARTPETVCSTCPSCPSARPSRRAEPVIQIVGSRR
jgi:hypothetical protein